MRGRLTALVLVAVVASLPAAPAPARAADWYDGPCTDDVGVTIVVDFQELGGGVNVRCAPGPVASGLDALNRAGISWEGTARFPGFVCRIAGRPGTDTEACVNTPPATAYWSYWLAPRGGRWCYSNLGAGNRTPPPGSVEGWSFALHRTAADTPPPRFTPPPPVGGVANPLGPADCTVPTEGATPTAPATSPASTTSPPTTSSPTTSSPTTSPPTTSPPTTSSPSAAPPATPAGTAPPATPGGSAAVSTSPPAPGPTTPAGTATSPATQLPPDPGDVAPDPAGQHAGDPAADTAGGGGGGPTGSATEVVASATSSVPGAATETGSGGPGVTTAPQVPSAPASSASVRPPGATGDPTAGGPSNDGAAAGAPAPAGAATRPTSGATLGSVDLGDDGRGGGGPSAFTIAAIAVAAGIAGGSAWRARRRSGR